MYISSESLKILRYILQYMHDSWVSLFVLMEFQNVWCNIRIMLIHNKDTICTTCDLIKVDLITLNNVIFETRSSSGSSHFLLLRSEDKNKDNVIKCFKMC